MNRHTRKLVAVSTALALSVAAAVTISSRSEASSITIETTTHIPPPGGSQAACLAPALAKAKAEWPQHQNGPSLAALDREITDKAQLCRNGLTMVDRLSSTSSTLSSAQCMGNCIYRVAHTVCDSPWHNCYVAPITTYANWSETLNIVFEARYHAWVECGPRYPGTSSWPDSASAPPWFVDDWNTGSGSVWQFARAWGFPRGYVLVRDFFDTGFIASWLPVKWHLRIWANLYPRGVVRWGLVGSSL